MKSSKERLLWAINAKALMKSADRSKFGKSAIDWMRKVKALKAQFLAYFSEQKSDSNDPDYQYLQSVITGKVPSLTDPEVGTRLTEILNRHSEDSAFISYVKQAVAVYRQAFTSMSKQFTWGRA